MTDDEKAARKLRVANRKFARETADYLFRVVQMWIVLALVLYFQRQSGSTLATVVMLVLSGALALYCFVTPMLLTEEWEINRDKDVPWVIYPAIILGTVLVFMPLMFADLIVDEMNRITHSTATSPASQTHQ